MDVDGEMFLNKHLWSGPLANSTAVNHPCHCSTQSIYSLCLPLLAVYHVLPLSTFTPSVYHVLPLSTFTPSIYLFSLCLPQFPLSTMYSLCLLLFLTPIILPVATSSSIPLSHTEAQNTWHVLMCLIKYLSELSSSSALPEHWSSGLVMGHYHSV